MGLSLCGDHTRKTVHRTVFSPFGEHANKFARSLFKSHLFSWSKKRHIKGAMSLAEKPFFVRSYGADLIRSKQIINADRVFKKSVGIRSILFDKLELVFYLFLFFLVSLSIMYHSISVSKSWKTNGLIIVLANLGCFE